MIPDAEIRRISRLVFEESYDIEIIKAYKDADTSRNTTTSPSADPHLSVTLAASTNYQFRFVIFTNNVAGVEGFRCEVDGTVGVTSMKAQIAIYDDTLNTLAAFARVTAINSPVGVVLSSGDNYTTIEGSIETSTAGTFALEWSQQVSGGNNTTVQRGSNLVVTKVS